MNTDMPSVPVLKETPRNGAEVSLKNDFGKYEPKEKTLEEYEDAFTNAHIKADKPPSKPDTFVFLSHFENGQILKTRHQTNEGISVITGRAKSKKSFLTSVYEASASTNGCQFGKITANLPKGKKGVLHFDTEQSDHDVFRHQQRVINLSGKEIANYGAFALREYTPRERCELIEYGLHKMQGNVGYVVIDGIADLANSINDEEEATRVVGLLLKWSKVYGCHIMTIIHQNKADRYATGHLGSALMKKAELVVSLDTDADDYRKSKVKCEMIRGAGAFPDFELEIDENGIPKIKDMMGLSSKYPVKEIK